jgi:steroid 5-alpha reductase family enzyme
MAVDAGGWWTFPGPLLMSVLLLRVSGVALLERQLRKRPAYAGYVARTSAFVPMPPRRG